MSARYRKILSVLAKRWLLGLVDARLGLVPSGRRREAFARQARLACEELGTSFIKIGQLISVRPDVFSSELVFELEKLRDRVPPMNYEVIREVITGEFGCPPEDLFSSFEKEAMASASIAQVHRAKLTGEARPAWGDPLPEGSDVVVKVIRPNVEETITADLEMARRFISRVKKTGLLRRVDVDSLLDQIEASLGREMDMRIEGRTAERFAFNFRRDEGIIIPRVVWKRTTKSVLTMEYIEGWPLSELASARKAGIDTHALALYGARAFMKQVLEHGLFHADLHHANLFATPDNRIAYLDFGIFDTLTAVERENVAHVLAALVYRDADRALKYSSGLGVKIRPDRIEKMRLELGRLMDRTLIGGSADEGPDMKHFGMGFMSLLKKYGVDIPVGYGLLVKSLVTVEGVSRGLYPDIDIIDTARPFVTRVLAGSLGDPARLKERIPAAVRAAVRELLV